MHEVYDAARPLYLKSDTHDIGHGARLLQVRNGMICGHDEIMGNTNLHPRHLLAKAYQVLSDTTAA